MTLLNSWWLLEAYSIHTPWSDCLGRWIRGDAPPIAGATRGRRLALRIGPGPGGGGGEMKSFLPLPGPTPRGVYK